MNLLRAPKQLLAKLLQRRRVIKGSLLYIDKVIKVPKGRKAIADLEYPDIMDQ